MIPKFYRIKIQYHTIDASIIDVLADSKEQAERFALFGWRGSHTEKCKDPVITEVVEI